MSIHGTHPVSHVSGPKTCGQLGTRQTKWNVGTRSAGFLLVRHFAWILVVLAGCSATSAPGEVEAQPEAAISVTAQSTTADIDINDPPATSDNRLPVAEDELRSELPIPLSLYLVADADDSGSGLSTSRTSEDLAEIAANVGAIWDQAGIVFDPINIAEITVPAVVIEAIALRGDTGPFFDQIGLNFDVPDPGLVNGFYVATAAGVNGFTPNGSRVFFVVDEPSVLDERVSSHELGHIFGLRHDLEDAGQLMFSGTNGMGLTNQEQEVARYGAEGLLETAR